MISISSSFGTCCLFITKIVTRPLMWTWWGKHGPDKEKQDTLQVRAQRARKTLGKNTQGDTRKIGHHIR